MRMKYSYLLKNMLMFILLLTSITTILSQAQICSKSNVIIDGHVNINSTSIMSAVGSTFRYCDELKSVSFQLDSATPLTKINDNDFADSGLQSIIIPNTVSSIGKNAFSNCSSLQYVTFEANSEVTSIGDYTFKSSTSLEAIYIPKDLNTIPTNILENTSVLTLYVHGANSFFSSRADSAYSFKGNPNNGPYSFLGSEHVDLIWIGCRHFGVGTQASAHCRGSHAPTPAPTRAHTSTSQSKGGETVGGGDIGSSGGGSGGGSSSESAFACLAGDAMAPSAGGNITIHHIVPEIGDMSFGPAPGVSGEEGLGCSQLKNIFFSDNSFIGQGSQLKLIDSGAFYGTSNLVRIVVPSSVTSIASMAFYGSNVENIYFGSPASYTSELIQTIDSVPTNTQSGRYIAVTDFTQSSLQTIGGSAFASSKLKSITIPANVESINNNAFEGSSLASIYFQYGSKLGEFSERVFASTDLQSFIIPNSITVIESKAFIGCTSLHTVNTTDASSLIDI